MSVEFVVDLCDGGHRFLKEPGVATRCPFCLAQGLASAREELAIVTRQRDEYEKALLNQGRGWLAERTR